MNSKTLSPLKILSLIVSIELVVLCFYLTNKILSNTDIEKNDKDIIALYLVTILIIFTLTIVTILIKSFVQLIKTHEAGRFHHLAVILLVIYFVCYDLLWLESMDQICTIANGFNFILNITSTLLIVYSIYSNIFGKGLKK